MAEHGERLGGALGGGRADQLDPGLEQLAGLAARGRDAAIAVGEVAEAERRLGGGIAARDHAGDRHGHVRAQDQDGTVLVEDAVGGLGFGKGRAAEHGLVLERGRVDLAVAVALEDAKESARDGADLTGLFG